MKFLVYFEIETKNPELTRDFLFLIYFVNNSKHFAQCVR